MIMERLSLLVILVTAVLVTMGQYHAQQRSALTVNTKERHTQLEPIGKMTVINVLVIMLYTIVRNISVEDHVLIIVVKLINMVILGIV
jgi:hypothetical protein